MPDPSRGRRAPPRLFPTFESRSKISIRAYGTLPLIRQWTASGKAWVSSGDKVVLVVPPANATLQRLLEVSGLGRILPVFQDRQQALSALA